MASSHHNSSTSTPVPQLGTPFNTISCFSDHLAYPPNAPQQSRWIHQRGRSSLRSPSSTIHPSQTVLPIPSLSVVLVDNDSNWKDASATNTIIANRPTSSTHSQSKPCQSDNTNKYLADVLGRLANTLNANQTSGPNINSRGTKAYISNILSSTEPDKLNNFLFQCHLYFCTNLAQFNTDIVKINFAITYFTGVVQDWFEVGLNQEDQGILQDWLFDWNLFVNELRQHFGLSDTVGKVANMLDNLHMKPSNKISTYNVDFIYYASQLGWGNSVLCHRYYQRLPNWIQNLISTWEQGKPTSFQDMYTLVITIDHYYWERDHERYYARQAEKEALESHSWKQEKASTSGPVAASQNKVNISLAASSTKTFSNSSLSPALKKQPNTPWVDLSSKLASNSKLTSDKCKKCFKNNLCLYCSAGDHKLDSCPKKQTTVTSKGYGASVTADSLAAASEKPLEK